MTHQVAILMSTYNGEKYLDAQIKSIINQTNPHWHLYIRDDGSRDRTPQIIQKYVRQDNRISWLNPDHVVNRGVTRSFMELLQQTTADFYMFCDQDDVWLPNKIQVTLNKMLQGDFATTPWSSLRNFRSWIKPYSPST